LKEIKTLEGKVNELKKDLAFVGTENSTSHTTIDQLKVQPSIDTNVTRSESA
jgi:hypothetical protein